VGYIDQLKAETNQTREEQVRAKRVPADPRLTEDWEPLTIQIQKLMAGLPPILRSGPFTLDSIRTKIRGKYNPSPSAGDTGIALSSLGFVRKRDYSNNGNGRRFWLPPSTG
jgi:hypothetical protein